jgi:hypothetical protein
MEHDCAIIIHFLQVQQFQHQEHQQCTYHGKYGKMKSSKKILCEDMAFISTDEKSCIVIL